MTNTWSPPPGPPGFTGPPAGSPTPRGRRIAAAVAAAAALIATGAGVTYAIMRPSTPGASTQASAAAKNKVCDTVQVATRGGFSDLRLPDNQVNVPVILRVLTGVVAVQNALTPAVPPDVASAARAYVNAALDVANAVNAGDKFSYSELNELNGASNEKLYAVLDSCGIPH